MAEFDYLHYIREKVGHELIFLTGACAIVTNEAGKVLIQRVPGGNWGLPGGLCELGEAAHETAVREVREETGLEIRIDELWGVYTKYYAECKNGDKLQPFVTLYTARCVGGELSCDMEETLELKYISRDEIPENIRNKQHLDMLLDYFEGRKGSFR